MPAGDAPAGAPSETAGFNAVFVGAAPGVPFLPRAEAFDPSTKRFYLQDANGNYIDVHPVDQIMALRCTTLVGQSKSATDLGTRLAIVCARQPSSRVPQLAYSEVSRVVADLIANGDILLISVVSNTAVRGRNLFAITYVNLRSESTNPQFPLQNATTINA